MASQEENEAHAGELFALYIEQRERGEDPDLESLLKKDPLAAPFLEQLISVHESIFPSMKQQQVGDYLLIRMIGRGGMGIVYEAEQLSLKRRVAIKLLPTIEATINPQSLDRFKREMTYLSKLEHLHIVPVFDAGEVDGRPYFVMPLLDGMNLAELLEERKKQGAGPVEEKQVIRWMVQIAGSLKYLHGKGIVHRDVKPSNIFITRDGGDARLLDFGLARSEDASALTLTGQSSGTPAYMSPEQLAGNDQAVAQTDLYLFGSTFFETLTLRRPFEGENWQLVCQAILKDPPPQLRSFNKKAGKDLESILLCCLNKKPDKRFSSAETLLEDLVRLENREPILTRPPSSLERRRRLLAKILREYPVPTVFGFCVIFSLIALLLVYRFVPPSTGVEDKSAFDIIFSDTQNTRRVAGIRSSTGIDLYESLTGRDIAQPLTKDSNAKLISLVEIDASNSSLEVVWDNYSLDLMAAGYGEEGLEKILWKLKDVNPKEEMEQWDGFKPCLIYPAPDLLEKGSDAIVFVIGKLKSTFGFFETAVLIVNGHGAISASYTCREIVGWNDQAVNVWDVDVCYPQDDKPELILSGMMVEDALVYPRPAVVVLKPIIGFGQASGAGYHNMMVLETVLPVTSMHPGVDEKIREPLIKQFKAQIPGPARWHKHYCDTNENGQLQVQFSEYSIYYYLEYVEETHRFEWLQVDYGDHLRPHYNEVKKSYDDLSLDEESIRKMKETMITTPKSWIEAL